jgi:hypothetical protein
MSRPRTRKQRQVAVHALRRRLHRGRPRRVLGLALRGKRGRRVHLPGQRHRLEVCRSQHSAQLVRRAHDPRRVRLRWRRRVAYSTVRPESTKCYLEPRVLCELARLRVQARLLVRVRRLHGLGHRHPRAPRPMALAARVLTLAVAVAVRFGVRAKRGRVLGVASGTWANGGGVGEAEEAAAGRLCSGGEANGETRPFAGVAAQRAGPSAEQG